MGYFWERIKEPSTWAGFSALFMLFGINVEAANAIATAGAAVAGAAAALIADKNNG